VPVSRPILSRMADQKTALPRLADALLDVGTRLREISDELRELDTGAAPQVAPGHPAGTAPADAAHAG